MKKWTILKGCHYSNFIPSIRLLKEETVFTETIEFTNSCRYYIEEASCVNKLFGFCFGLFGVHKNSARFGWKYNTSTSKIDILEYYYKDGKLIKNPVAEISIGEKIAYRIKVTKQQVTLYINNKPVSTMQFDVKKKLLLTLGFYFGGNTRAPHTMNVNKY